MVVVGQEKYAVIAPLSSPYRHFIFKVMVESKVKKSLNMVASKGLYDSGMFSTVRILDIKYEYNDLSTLSKSVWMVKRNNFIEKDVNILTKTNTTSFNKALGKSLICVSDIMLFDTYKEALDELLLINDYLKEILSGELNYLESITMKEKHKDEIVNRWNELGE